MAPPFMIGRCDHKICKDPERIKEGGSSKCLFGPPNFLKCENKLCYCYNDFGNCKNKSTFTSEKIQQKVHHMA